MSWSFKFDLNGSINMFDPMTATYMNPKISTELALHTVQFIKCLWMATEVWLCSLNGVDIFASVNVS